MLGTLGSQDAVQGHDLQLTVDLDVQQLVEDSLSLGLDAARHTFDKDSTKRNFEAPARAAVVLDPRDGSLLAMASVPAYNPSDFVNGIRGDVFWYLTAWMSAVRRWSCSGPS